MTAISVDASLFRVGHLERVPLGTTYTGIVAHVARLLAGHDFRRILAVSMPLGAAFMLYADQAARLIFTPSEIPVGLVAAMVGAPLMIYVARRVL